MAPFLTACTAVAVTVLLGGSQHAGEGGTDGGLRAGFVAASRGREQAASDARIYFSEATRTDESQSVRILYGYVQFARDREEWARIHCDPGEDLEQYLNTPRAGFELALERSEPLYEVLGQGRSLVLQHEEGDAWKGVLLDDTRRSARGGALGLGLFLRERWLSTAVEGASRVLEEDEELICVFGRHRGEDDVILRLEGHRPREIEWERSGRTMFQYRVTEWVEFGGVLLPAAGGQRHGYGPGGTTEAVLEYVPLPAGEPEGLLALPSRLARAGRHATLKDEASGQRMILGPEGLKGGVDPRPVESGPRPAFVPPEGGTWTPADWIPVAVVGAIALLLLWSRSR